MASASQFIGAHISLTSTSDIRYRGILTEIDHGASTIQLRNVYSLGTENRRPADEYLPPNDTPYEFIVFRAAEVKDLAVERAPPPPPQQRSVLQDPAVIGASGGGAPVPQPPPQAPAPPVASSTPVPAKTPEVEQPKTEAVVAPVAQSGPANAHNQARPTNSRERSSASVRSAEVAVDNVEKAMGDLRIASQTGGGGGRRGGRSGGEHIRGPGVVPNTPFDFARSNAKFNKASVLTPSGANSTSATSSPALAEASTSQSTDGESDKPASKFYDKKKSFFDDISSDSRAKTEGEGVVTGAAAARQRREEERNRNLNTFGEVAIQWPVGTPQYNYRRGGGRRRGQGGNRTQGANGQPR
ncbi:hypothetical protein FRC03_010316 [Tulasnella sp. 419]|nr:hypothetical protein FRC03_010316 [Tulasnella sp. 419]